MAKFKPLPPLAELQAAFDYDPETGLFRHQKTRQSVQQGSIAGSYNKQCYLVLTLRPRRLNGHRVAWYMSTGEDPLHNKVDHIDRDPTNNRLNNLRLCNTSQNRINSLHKGYTYRKTTGHFEASIYHQGEVIHLGTFLKAEEAEKAYREKAVELRGEFAPQEWVM